MTDSRSDVRFRVSQIDHVELFVPDRDEAAKWYEEVLGLTVLPGYEDWAKDPHGPLMISSDDGSTKLDGHQLEITTYEYDVATRLLRDAGWMPSS